MARRSSANPRPNFMPKLTAPGFDAELKAAVPIILDGRLTIRAARRAALARGIDAAT
jgi:hypothetical protein